MNPARLFVIVAREAETAVIFRRGPSKRVRVIHWDLKTDSFELGQWFFGRIYERRCDLSPDGKYLAYYAASNREPPYSWTAISRPPFLTALVLWEGCDISIGGGSFAANDLYLLNDESLNDPLRGSIPAGLNVELYRHPEANQSYEWLWHSRLERDGWALTNLAKDISPDYHKQIYLDYGDSPLTFEKPSPKNPAFRLQLRLKGLSAGPGPKYMVDHNLIDEMGTTLSSYPDTDWADWCRNGDLLYSKKGKLFRALWDEQKQTIQYLDPKEIADFTEMKFSRVASPKWAKNWD